jgi:hypothetical protein
MGAVSSDRIAVRRSAGMTKKLLCTAAATLSMTSCCHAIGNCTIVAGAPLVRGGRSTYAPDHVVRTGELHIAHPSGRSVDRALTNARFRSVPTALEWAEHSKFMRDVESLREWRARISQLLGTRRAALLSENL